MTKATLALIIIHSMQNMGKAKKRNLAEKRKFVRARRELTIEYRLYKRKGKAVDGVWQVSVTKNMSVAGILFVSEVPYLIGDIIQARVVMAGALDVFRGFGRVVRVEEKKSKRSFDVAMAFVEEHSKLVKPSKRIPA